MQPRKILSLDVETSIINNGDPYHPDNRLVLLGYYDGKQYKQFYKDFPLEIISADLANSIIITVNGKNELAWLSRIGIDISSIQSYDCQIAEFLISNQTHSYPSLDDIAEKYLGQKKLDFIKLNYWDKGIDTWFIPQQELEEYHREDLRLTWEAFHKQKEILINENKWNLFLLQAMDQSVLFEMEWNGIKFEKEKSIQKGEELNAEIENLKSSITKYSNHPEFNCNSGDHLSCLLYGGTINYDLRVPVGVYKTGQKVGHTRYKIFPQEYPHPRLVEPLKGSELKKEGYWSTAEDILLQLRPKDKEVKQLIKDILRLSELEKLQGTYYFGIPKLIDKKGWTDNLLHGKLNQCVARTGRLSATEPNQQNFDPNIKQLCVSRYV